MPSTDGLLSKVVIDEVKSDTFIRYLCVFSNLRRATFLHLGTAKKCYMLYHDLYTAKGSEDLSGRKRNLPPSLG